MVKSLQNHTLRYQPFSQPIFKSFTQLWETHHSAWKNLDKNAPYCDDKLYAVTYPVCIDDVAIDASQDISKVSCSRATCKIRSNGCLVTPPDTMDYLPPITHQTVDSPELCQFDEGNHMIQPPDIGMDSGIPPEYIPISVVRLNITGKVFGYFNNRCQPINDAKIVAWQINPLLLNRLTVQDSFEHSINNSRSISTTKGLRELSSSGLFHTNSDGRYQIKTLVPPSYGPPRHIMLEVSAPGFQTLSTRMYFDVDWRLQQLTTLGGNVNSRNPFSAEQQYGFLETNKAINSKFPGEVAKDPRVANLIFRNTSGYKNDIKGDIRGYFETSFDITLQSLHPNTPTSAQTVKDISDVPPINVNGLWADADSGALVSVITHGNTFVASEYPHPRSWGIVYGIIQGNFIRNINFRTQHFRMNIVTNSDNTINSNNYFEMMNGGGNSKGLIIPNDPTASNSFSNTAPDSISIQWSGGNYDSYWLKRNDLNANGYRYLKLLITRETGGFKNGQMKINEIMFYQDILSSTEFPIIGNKMKTPRTPNPQSVTCSSFLDQTSHCYKAFDGDSSSNSVWVTKPVGSYRNALSQPQWVIFDFGEGRGVYPTAMKIVCDSSNSDQPLGCPMTFILLGSYDNKKYDMLYKKDMFDYDNDYKNGGLTFYFTFETSHGRVNGQSCGSCEKGPKFSCSLDSFDSSCNSTYCNRYGTCDDLPICPLGEYQDLHFTGFDLPSFRCLACAPGRFGSTSGLTNSYCSGKCLAGYYCQSGSITSTQNDCGDPSVFCPEGTGYPIKAAAGRKTLSTVSNSSLSVMSYEVLCSIGHYCIGGIEYPCPVGRYGNSSGLQTSECSGSCLSGEYCPAGSIIPLVCDEGTYCPDGSFKYYCPAGTFGAAKGLKDKHCTGLCSKGYYCPEGSKSSTTAICPSGRYGGISGLKNKDCSGECTAGFYCPSGSVSDQEKMCGSKEYYCPIGSSFPLRVAIGYYSIGGVDTRTRTSQSVCEKGFYCTYGKRLSCPSGSFGNSIGLSSDFSYDNTQYYNSTYSSTPSSSPTTYKPSQKPTLTPSTFAPSLTRAPTRSPSATQRHSPDPTSRPTSSPSNPSNYSAVPTVSTTTIEQSLTRTYICSGFCEKGFYCPQNSTSNHQFPCPAGRYGSTNGLTDATCTAICPLGHYCPEGSIKPKPCPAGRFGSSLGLIDSSCSADCWVGGCKNSVCSEGYFCPEGSISNVENGCGHPGVYCPAGAPEPKEVADGYYTIGGDEDTRTDQKLCDLGYYCTRGVRRVCPPGVYGNTTGLTSINCSGLCPVSYYCPEGSTNGTTYKCPAGRYGSSKGLFDSSCSGECMEGYYCPEGSNSPNMYQCGMIQTSNQSIITISEPNNVYCPPKSLIPVRVLPGYYSIGGNRTTRLSQTPCQMGTYCMNGESFDCPAGRYGRAEQLTHSNCTGLCKKGYYCPIGSISRTQLPCPAGRYGNEEGLTNSLCSGSCPHFEDCSEGSISPTVPLAS
eukprot:gene6767-9268_t